MFSSVSSLIASHPWYTKAMPNAVATARKTTDGKC